MTPLVVNDIGAAPVMAVLKPLVPINQRFIIAEPAGATPTI
jgi:hypothetical protein